MSTVSLQEKPLPPLWRAYWELTKPGVVALLMVTAVIGMFLKQMGLGIVIGYAGGRALAFLLDSAADQAERKAAH